MIYSSSADTEFGTDSVCLIPFIAVQYGSSSADNCNAPTSSSYLLQSVCSYSKQLTDPLAVPIIRKIYVSDCAVSVGAVAQVIDESVHFTITRLMVSLCRVGSTAIRTLAGVLI